MSGASALPGDRAIVLEASVRSLCRWWIEVVASDRGTGRLRVADVLILLRCDNCGEPPVRAALAQDPAAGARDREHVPGWRVVLIGHAEPVIGESDF